MTRIDPRTQVQPPHPAIATRWTVSPPRQLLWRSWDEELVVFDPLSGDTHVLNPLAAEVLQVLESQAMDGEGLSQHLALAMDTQPNDTLRKHIQLLLTKFVSLGLIEPYCP